MKHRTRLGQEHEQQAQFTSNPAPLEFASAEDMLRHDAERTPVPTAIEERLRASAAPLRPQRPWWRRLFGG